MTWAITTHMEALADEAFESNESVACRECNVLVVPDLEVLQGVTNGLQVPNTYRLLRDDGRMAYLFRLPDPWEETS
jgi:hypothetical protein